MIDRLAPSTKHEVPTQAPAKGMLPLEEKAMRALRVHELGSAEEVLREEDVETPLPGPGQVRIRVAASALNFADDLLCRGKYQI